MNRKQFIREISGRGGLEVEQWSNNRLLCASANRIPLGASSMKDFFWGFWTYHSSFWGTVERHRVEKRGISNFSTPALFYCTQPGKKRRVPQFESFYTVPFNTRPMLKRFQLPFVVRGKQGGTLVCHMLQDFSC